jgi:hypothetical protein
MDMTQAISLQRSAVSLKREIRTLMVESYRLNAQYLEKVRVAGRSDGHEDETFDVRRSRLLLEKHGFFG